MPRRGRVWELIQTLSGEFLVADPQNLEGPEWDATASRSDASRVPPPTPHTLPHPSHAHSATIPWRLPGSARYLCPRIHAQSFPYRGQKARHVLSRPFSHSLCPGVHTQPQLNTTLKQAGASGASPASGDPVGITTFLLRWSVCVLCSAMMPTTRPVQSHFSIPCFRSPSQGCGVKLPPLPQTAPLHLPRPAGSERWRGTHGRGRGKGK